MKWGEREKELTKVKLNLDYIKNQIYEINLSNQQYPTKEEIKQFFNIALQTPKDVEQKTYKLLEKQYLNFSKEVNSINKKLDELIKITTG